MAGSPTYLTRENRKALDPNGEEQFSKSEQLHAEGDYALAERRRTISRKSA